jgi:hypothetical protein
MARRHAREALAGKVVYIRFLAVLSAGCAMLTSLLHDTKPFSYIHQEGY